jgi:hypothetical protein
VKNAVIYLAFCVALMSRCGPTRLSGGTIDTGNAKLTARIHTSAGSLAVRASVTVCPAEYLPSMGADSAANTLRFVKETATDDSGYFRIDTLDKGAYRIEVNDGSSSAVLLDVTSNDSSLLIDDTLRPYAAVEGNAGSLSAASIKRYLFIYGLNRRIEVNANGSFALHDLPAGTFRFRIVAENGTVSPVELDSVIARSRDTVFVPFAGWLYSAKITLNTAASGADVARDVYGFPAIVRLTTANFHFDQAMGSGSDCRFAKRDGSPLSFGIEQWDSARGMATIWVRVDTVFGNNGTQSFTMLWGNPRVASIANSTTVFDTANGFMGVYHFGGNLNDATANGYNGIDNNTVDTLGGIIGSGRAFNGESQYFQVGDLPDRQGGTVSCWFRPKATFNSSTQKTQGIWGKKSTDSLDFTLSLMGKDFYTGPSGSLGSDAYGSLLSKLETPDTGYYLITATSSFSGGVWYYVSWTWGNDENFIYIDGKAETSDTHSFAVSGDGNDEIGRASYDGSNIQYGGPRYFNGALDEFRIDNRPRSADWIKLCYMNQRQDDKLVTFQLR